jgi:hypothetical protein
MAEQVLRLQTLSEHSVALRFVRGVDRAPDSAARRPAWAGQDGAAPHPRQERPVAPVARPMSRSPEAPLAAVIGRLETTVRRLVDHAREGAWPTASRTVASTSQPDPKLIAEQVLRTLDHRVVALRERMGRR